MASFIANDPRIDTLVYKVLQLEERMTAMTAAQEQLNTIVTKFDTALGNLVTEVAGLKEAAATGTPLDFSGLDASLASLQAVTTVDENAVVEPPVEP